MSKKDNIKAAALQILVDNGIHATPMSAIAKAANTGMGTIYNYYPTKEALINAIYLDIKEREEKLLVAPHKKRSIKSIFIHYYLTVTNFYLENPDYFRFVNQLQSSPIITPENKAKGYQAIQPVIEMLKRGQQEGLIKKMSIEELLQFIGGALLSHLAWLIMRGGKPESGTTHHNQIALVWDAIKK